MRNLLSRFLAVMLALLGSVAAANAQASYSIQRGDTLSVEVLEDNSLNRSVLVLPDGNISFPQAGTIQVAGRTVEQVAGAISAALAPNFAAPPNVYVSVGQLVQRPPSSGGRAAPATMRIYAMGEVAKPGGIDVLPGTTLLQALAEAGGFTKFGASKRIELRRTDPSSHTERVYLFNYRGGGGISGSTVLQAGDVIVVPERRLFE